MPSLTLEEMGQIIDRGESVFVRDGEGRLRLVARRQDLPTEADLAGQSGDPAKKAAAKEAIAAQIKALQDASDSLDRTPAPAPPKAETPAPPFNEPLPLPEPKPQPKGK